MAPHSLYLKGPLPVLTVPVKTANDRLETLEVRGLSYCYPGSGRGIVGIDLRLRRGSLTVVTGYIGAGKTTLLQVLLGLQAWTPVRFAGMGCWWKTQPVSLCRRAAPIPLRHRTC